MNVCAPAYTQYQERIVDRGRKHLVEKWNGRQYAQGPAYRAVFKQLCTDEDSRPVDRFHLTHCSEEPGGAAWASECWRPKPVSRSLYYVDVPHSHYFSSMWLPFSVDRACFTESVVFLVVSTVSAGLIVSIA